MLPSLSGATRAGAIGDTQEFAMIERKEPSSLEELNARLRKARKEADDAAGRSRPKADMRSGLAFAMRLGVELVATLIVGGGIGLLLDRWLGTTPWLMLVFFILGAAAGMLNIYRVMTGLAQGISYGHKENGGDTGSPHNRSDRG